MLLSTVGAGDYFGELALLPGGNTRAATVRARTDVSLLVLDRANFESLLGPLMPQLQASAKSYTGYSAKHGIQVRTCRGLGALVFYSTHTNDHGMLQRLQAQQPNFCCILL